MNNTFLTGVNAVLQPQFSWGYPGAEELPEDQYFARRMKLDLFDVERAATALFGEFMGLLIDEEIFRGAVPADRDEGFEVFINSERNYIDLRYRLFDIECHGRSGNREKIVRSFASLNSKLPLPSWVSVNYQYMNAPIHFAGICRSGYTNFSDYLYNGKAQTCGSVSLQAAVAVIF